MHKLLAGVTILEHELSELRLLVERQTGVLLDCPNSALAAHIADYLEAHGLESPTALLDRLRACDQDPATLPQFLEGLLNSDTGCFRHPGAMSALSKQIVPQICARKAGEGPATLRIWSAGCGTGEEVYSIAMAICDSLHGTNGSSNGSNGNGNGTKENAAKENGTKEKAGTTRNGGIAETPVPPATQLSRDWSIHIVGTDLLPSAIEVAERGLYPQSSLAGLPPAAIRACFSKIAPNGNSGQESSRNAAGNGSWNGSGTGSASAAHLLVKPRLRSLVTFNTM